MSTAPTPDNETAALRAALDELREAYDELREAQTTREREEASAELADARDELELIAERTGISRANLERAIAETKQAEQREKLRPIVAELIREANEQAAKDAAAAAGEDDPPAEDEPPADDTEEEAPKPVKTRAAKRDSEPVVPHWSDRALFGGKK